MQITPQIIGGLAVAAFLFSYQQKKRNNIILFNTVSRCLYILQYLLLGAFSGAVLDVMGAISSVAAGKKHAGFIINAGGATANDVRRLIEHVRTTVLRDHGIELESEVQILTAHLAR